MKEEKYLSPENSDMQDRLWDYLDGVSTAEEKTTIEELLERNIDWREKYRELLELHQLIRSTDLESPSLRFTKNIMEEIGRAQIAPATKIYINKKIIWGIGFFFASMIVGFLIYSFMQIDWAANGTTGLPVDFSKVDLSKVDFSKIFNNTYVTIFMMVNVVLGLMLLDRFLENRRKQQTVHRS